MRKCAWMTGIVVTDVRERGHSQGQLGFHSGETFPKRCVCSEPVFTQERNFLYLQYYSFPGDPLALFFFSEIQDWVVGWCRGIMRCSSLLLRSVLPQSSRGPDLSQHAQQCKAKEGHPPLEDSMF